MKKLIMIFAMVSLVTSSLLNMANLTKHHRSQILEPTKNQQKNFGAINWAI